jgi:hypothetical protein
MVIRPGATLFMGALGYRHARETAAPFRVTPFMEWPKRAERVLMREAV